MKKIILLILLLPYYSKGQKCMAWEMRPTIAQAIEFSMLEATAHYGSMAYFPDSTVQRHFDACFPIRDNDMYRMVFVTDRRTPRVAGTVTFNHNVDLKAAIVDTVQRDLTPIEASVLEMILAAETEINEDPYLPVYPDCIINVIPLITIWGRKVFLTWRSDDIEKFVFGADYEMNFNERNEILSVFRVHQTTRFFCNKELSKDQPYAGTGYHSHEAENFQGLSISDLGGLFFNNRLLRRESFVISDKTHVYQITMQPFDITRYTRKEYTDLKGPLPPPTDTCSFNN